MRKMSCFVALMVAIILTVSACSSGSSSLSTKVNNNAAKPTGDTIKVGILNSLSGTMAASEVPVKDAILMAIDEINKAGGVLGKQIEPKLEDGASDPSVFAEKTQKLLASDKVATIFGAWISPARKAMLPVLQAQNGLLWYPVQYEGLEKSPNVFYIGATADQQIVPAIDWLLKNKGKRAYLLGSDNVFARTANGIVKEQLKAEGAELLGEEYTPYGHTEYSTIISKIKDLKPDFIFNTVNGDSNVALFKQLKDAGVTPDVTTILSVSVGEEEIRSIGPQYMAGHLAAWNYFQSIDTPENKKFIGNYQQRYGSNRTTSDPIEAGYTAVYLWAKAVEKAGTTDVNAVRNAAKGIEFDAPGGKVKIDGDNQHIYKTARIGKIKSEGQFEEIWSSDEPVKPDPYLQSYDWATKYHAK
ncbi:urea ABC transporter substrate-binding protein [Paenibacillus sp. FSL H7-0326]|uniref:urea ABC transporter substrate-binding protein n=1 Tax=Paenibacillus sp. FSL H7-0326 TaxID=1921144 RepID=UPI00096C58F1|nr:urea ABC transporter substrate-binding protein [Paenibacillus sp. FSL H7-0326]OMC71411.1 urea ABC transporter substrate-binding protein [Paenibacillus sp. FSL H7-0326]